MSRLRAAFFSPIHSSAHVNEDLPDTPRNYPSQHPQRALVTPPRPRA